MTSRMTSGPSNTSPDSRPLFYLEVQVKNALDALRRGDDAGVRAHLELALAAVRGIKRGETHAPD